MSTPATTLPIRLHEGPFVNEPMIDFSRDENARRMRGAIAQVRSQMGHEHELGIGGKRVRTQQKIHSLNPACPSEVVGIHQDAGIAEVEPAMQAALHENAQTFGGPLRVSRRAQMRFFLGGGPRGGQTGGQLADLIG